MKKKKQGYCGIFAGCSFSLSLDRCCHTWLLGMYRLLYGADVFYPQRNRFMPLSTNAAFHLENSWLPENISAALSSNRYKISHAVCSEWPDAALTAALMAAYCDLRRAYSSGSGRAGQYKHLLPAFSSQQRKGDCTGAFFWALDFHL